MNDIVRYLNEISTLDKSASDDFVKEIKSKVVPKDEFLLQPGQVCKYFYYLEKGLVKSYSFHNDKEFIMAFYQEHMLFTELSSYLSQQPSKHMLIALEPSTIQYIHRASIEKLCKKHHCIETLLRKLFTITSVCFMDRISEMLEENAKERYTNFVNDYPTLLQRISLGDLANYIGITQVSLSRIRAAR
jgi:CRP-like cAMP-binding protein